jgi:hypothetical protein
MTASPVHFDWHIEFRLIEMAKGLSDSHAIMGFNVETITGCLQGHAGIWHSDKEGSCSQDILYVGLGKKFSPQLPLYDRVLNWCLRLEREHQMIVRVMVADYHALERSGYIGRWNKKIEAQRKGRDMDTGRIGLSDYFDFHRLRSPLKGSIQSKLRKNKSLTIIPPEQALAAVWLKGAFRYDSPLTGPFRDRPANCFLTKWPSTISPPPKGARVQWFEEGFWDDRVGPRPGQTFRMTCCAGSPIWSFSKVGTRPGPRSAPSKAMAKKIIEEYWFSGYRPDVLQEDHFRRYHLIGPLGNIGYPKVAKILSERLGIRHTKTTIRKLVEEINSQRQPGQKLKSSRKGFHSEK